MKAKKTLVTAVLTGVAALFALAVWGIVSMVLR